MKKKLVSLIAFALALVMAMTSLPVGAVSSQPEISQTAFAEEESGRGVVSPMYTTGDTYPAYLKNAPKDSIVDPWNFYNRECTSFAAWCLNDRNGVGFTNQYLGAARWGHAKTWGTVAQGLDVAVNNNPAVGSIAWWNTGTYGHVAWVSAVNGSSVTIEEYNYASAGNFGTRTISASSPAGYIHIKDIQTVNHYPDKPILTAMHNYDLTCAIPEWNSVYLSWTSGGSNCSWYNLYVYNADNGEHLNVYYSSRVTADRLNLQLPPGNYKFRIAAVNALDPNVYYTFSDYTADLTVQDYNTSFHCRIKTYQGHTYAILTNGGIATADWKSAKQLCELLGGHLPTISSSGENETIKSLVSDHGNPNSKTWLGASDAEQEGVWTWVTGEPFNYSNWYASQPDNYGNDEDFLQMYADGTWNDVGSGRQRHNVVIEFDYLTSSFPTDEMKTADFNGHTYTLYKHTMYDWYDAKAFCENQGGTLLCIETESEQAFIDSFISDFKLGSVFLGATDAESEGNWKWVNGEALTYTNWDPLFNDPQFDSSQNNSMMMLHPTRKGKWVDYYDSGSMCYVIMEKEAEVPTTEPPTTPPVTEPPVTAAPDAPQIVVGSKTATQGSTVTVDVSLLNNPGIVSMALTVDFDERLTLTGVSDSGLIPGQVHSPTMGNPYVLCWVNDTATENFTGNGVIATLTFEVPEDMPVGEYPITVSYDLDNYDIYNCDVELVEFAVVNGRVNVIDVLIGDVNTDTKVNALDRLYLTRFLAKWADYPEAVINMIAADVNVDTKVNALDRLILTRHLAKWAGYEKLPYTAKSAPEAKKAETKGDGPTINVDSVTANPGETVTVCVSLENNPGIVSMTLTVDFDEALELIGRTDTGLLPGQVHSPTLGNPYTLCWVNDTATTNYTVNGTIVELTFRLSENAAPGEYPITISYDLDNYDIYNCDVEPVEFAVVNGGVTYEEPQPTTYTVTFTVNGEYYTSYELEAGEAVTAPEYEAPEGHTFSGWNVPDTMPAEDITLDATLTVNSYTVTFVDSVSGDIIAEVLVNHGEAAPAPEAPAHAWYTFTGWDKDFSCVTEDMTVTAQYEEKGDVNGDGAVSIEDAIALMRYLLDAGSIQHPEQGDVNGDGNMNLMDALMLLRHVMGVID